MSEPAPERDEPRRYVCDVEGCGYEAATPRHLGLHKRNAHGIEGKGEKRGKKDGGRRPGRPRKQAADTTPRRPSSEPAQARRKRAVKETILEFLDFADELRGKSDPLAASADLADVIRRDADRIATSLAWAAERFNPVALVIDRMAGHGSVITFARGFLGVGTALLRKWRRAVTEREQTPEISLWPLEEYVRGGSPMGEAPPGTVYVDEQGGFYDAQAQPLSPNGAVRVEGAEAEGVVIPHEFGGSHLPE